MLIYTKGYSRSNQCYFMHVWLCMGDLYQLPPVAQLMLFSIHQLVIVMHSQVMQLLYKSGSLWQVEFEMLWVL